MCFLQVGWISRRSKQNWVPERYPMFVAWILNFQVNLKKIISLEPLSEYALFTCQNHPPPPPSPPPKNCRNNGEYLLISFFIPIIKKISNFFWESQSFLPKFYHVQNSGCCDNCKCSKFIGKVSWCNVLARYNLFSPTVNTRKFVITNFSIS